MGTPVREAQVEVPENLEMRYLTAGVL